MPGSLVGVIESTDRRAEAHMGSVAEWGAYSPALILAIEQYETSPPIVDPDAIRLLPPTLHLRALASRWAPARQAMIAATEKKICGGWAGVLCRKRYIDEQLIDTLTGGFDAVIILGGGVDTRLYRIPQLTGVPVWEVDLPANSIRKQQVAARRFGYIPRRATYVAADLATENMTKCLSDSGFDPDMRAFVIWEAVSMYLTEATVRRTLRHMLALAPGSRLAFTFLRKAFVDGFAMYGARWIRRICDTTTVVALRSTSRTGRRVSRRVRLGPASTCGRSRIFAALPAPCAPRPTCFRDRTGGDCPTLAHRTISLELARKAESP